LGGFPVKTGLVDFYRRRADSRGEKERSKKWKGKGEAPSDGGGGPVCRERRDARWKIPARVRKKQRVVEESGKWFLKRRSAFKRSAFRQRTGSLWSFQAMRNKDAKGPVQQV